jgi:hypothetical protein
MELLLGILLSYGITNIVTQGSIFYSTREWFGSRIHKSKICSFFYKLLNCPMCFGFWAGALAGIFLGPFIWWNILFNGALYSGTTWIIFCLTQFLGQGYDPSRTLNVVFQNPLEQKDINKEDKPK